jgi:hypothetical protein
VSGVRGGMVHGRSTRCVSSARVRGRGSEQQRVDVHGAGTRVQASRANTPSPCRARPTRARSAAGGRSARLVNPLAWDKGAVFCQCQHCQVWHMLRADKSIVEEIRCARPRNSPKEGGGGGRGEGGNAAHGSRWLHMHARTTRSKHVARRARCSPLLQIPRSCPPAPGNKHTHAHTHTHTHTNTHTHTCAPGTMTPSGSRMCRRAWQQRARQRWRPAVAWRVRMLRPLVAQASKAVGACCHAGQIVGVGG